MTNDLVTKCFASKSVMQLMLKQHVILSGTVNRKVLRKSISLPKTVLVRIEAENEMTLAKNIH